MTPTRRLGWTAALFAAALVCVVVASALHSVAPVFVAWIPLLAVAWILTRPEPVAGSRNDPEAVDDAGSDAGPVEGPGPVEGSREPAP